MKRVSVIILVLLLLSCTRTIYVPVESVKHVTTTVVDTFVEIVTPNERVVNVTTDTTSVISTRYATSKAEVSNGILRHEITQHERKDSVKTQTVYIHETDSVPYPVKVVEEVTPSWCWWSILIGIIAVATMIVICVIKR